MCSCSLLLLIGIQFVCVCVCVHARMYVCLFLWLCVLVCVFAASTHVLWRREAGWGAESSAGNRETLWSRRWLCQVLQTQVYQEKEDGMLECYHQGLRFSLWKICTVNSQDFCCGWEWCFVNIQNLLFIKKTHYRGSVRMYTIWHAPTHTCMSCISCTHNNIMKRFSTVPFTHKKRAQYKANYIVTNTSHIIIYTKLKRGMNYSTANENDTIILIGNITAML